MGLPERDTLTNLVGVFCAGCSEACCSGGSSGTSTVSGSGGISGTQGTFCRCFRLHLLTPRAESMSYGRLRLSELNHWAASSSTKGPNPLPDSIVRSDQLLREISKADQRNRSSNDLLRISVWSRNDCIGPLHWFPVATKLNARLSQKVDRGAVLRVVQCAFCRTQSSTSDSLFHQIC